MEEINILKEYLKGVSKYPLLNREEERELFKKFKEGSNVAKEKLINSNLRLVIKIAKEFKPNKEITFMDIIQNGNMGLIRAIEKFDYEKGESFSTYACFWIRQNIIRGFEKSKYNGGASFRMAESYRKVMNFVKYFQKINGRIPNINEIEKETNVSKKLIFDVLKSISSNTAEVSFSSFCETNDELLDNISDNSYNPEVVIEKKMMEDDIKKVLISVPDREKEVLKERFGFSSDKKTTLMELGKKYSLTSEGIRQIEKRILAYIKINYPFLANYLYS
ncbi:MAG: sigma-70 family RNA polymerase sigma factor [Brevinematales bacterium]|nr:sigma-70 family RNA polymerase sigma factor [Brevinematales bacterium]